MGTLTVKLPPPLEARLNALAKKRGATKSAVVRAMIEKGLADPDDAGVTVLDLVRDLKGIGKGAKDLATNPKHMRGYGE